jgi:MFS family permease
MNTSAQSPRSRPAVSSSTGFWTVALAFMVVMAIGALPTPLYVLYEQRDHLTGFLVTVVFAAYAGGVITSLFLAGHVSDWFGRRRVLIPAIVLQAGAAAVFALWPSLAGLLAARVLSGLAVGAITATATAYLAELHRAGSRQTSGRRAELVAIAANLGGLGLGPLSAGLFAQFLPDPLVLPYVVFGLLALMLALAASLVQETAGVAQRPRYRTQRISVPPDGARRFLAATAGAMIAFAVFGLFTSLAPSFLAVTLGYGSHVLAGATAFLVFAAGALSQSLLARSGTRRLTAIGIVLMLAGLALVIAATWLPDLAAFLAGGLLSGAGAGLLIRAGIDTVVGLAPPEARAEGLATFFLAAYLGLSVPIVGLGVATQYVSPRLSLLGFAGVLVVGLVAVGRSQLGTPRRRRERGRKQTGINYQGARS